MEISTVMFDCDGVLIDSEALVNRIHVDELARLGLGVSVVEMLQRFCGVRDDEMFAEIERDWNVRLPAGYSDVVGKRILDEYPVSLNAIDGVEQALSRLPQRLCVVSSSPPDKLRFGLDLVNLSRFFDPNIFSGWSVASGKPAPDVYLFAAERMAVRPSHCIVIEDSVAGVCAGFAAGMTVLGFDGGSHCLPGHDARLLRSGARLVFSDMADLPQILERL